MEQLHDPDQAALWLQQNGVSSHLVTDSRRVAAGDGFLAWAGASSDARRFVPSACAAGAAACLVEHEGAQAFDFAGLPVASYHGLKADSGRIAAAFYQQPSHNVKVLAVTGTNGKTSTAWWLAQALSALPLALRISCGFIGTLGAGRPPFDITSTGMTTPDAVLLSTTLHQFRQAGMAACAIEASSIGIEEHRLDGTDVTVAIFTNFTQDHLDYHGTMQAYWQAKLRLFWWPGLKSAVINVDDEQGSLLAAELASQAATTHSADTGTAPIASALDLWTVSIQHSARLWADHIRYSSTGIDCVVREGTQEQTLRTQLIGSYNISNLLGVIAAMRSLGVPLADAVQVCTTLAPVPGRMECVGGVAQPLVAVDYAHTPDALSHALSALRPMAQARQGKLWCVFGCGGDRDSAKRPLMGAIAAKLADKVVVTSDNPRSEKVEAIIGQILLGLPSCNSTEVQADRALAIAHTIAQAGDADVVLIAGKGHEATQEIAGIKTPFSDREHASAALARRTATLATTAAL